MHKTTIGSSNNKANSTFPPYYLRDRLSKLGVLLLMFLCFSCATLVSKSTYPVHINTEPQNAQITIKNHQGSTVFIGTTPAVVHLDTSSGYFKGTDYSIIIELAGYETQIIPIERKLDDWYIYGNLVSGLLLGWLVIDPATGAMWTLEDVDTILCKQEVSIHIDNKKLNLVFLSNDANKTQKHSSCTESPTKG